MSLGGDINNPGRGVPATVITGSATGLWITPLDHGAKFDARNVQDASIEAGSKALTIPELTPADVGKVIVIGGAGANGGALVTKLTAAVAGKGTTAAAAATTVEGAAALYGTDDSKAWKEMAEAMTLGRGYTIECPFGRSMFNQLVLGSVLALSGVTIKLSGAGDRGTFLHPISAAGAKSLLTVNGPGDATSIGFETENLTIGFDSNDPVVDFPYTEPWLHLNGIRGYDLKHAARQEGTGTIHKLESSWEGRVDKRRIKTGRFAVGWEFDDGGIGEFQEDTIDFDPIHEGNYGVVVRNVTHGLDSLTAKLKSAVYPTTDRFHFGEGHLAKEAKEGETTIELEAGQAAAIGYAAGALPLPVCVHYGDHVEVNKVIGVAGDVLTLAQPLGFAHAAGIVVALGTFALSLPTNYQSATIGPGGCHLEGHTLAAIMTDGGQMLSVLEPVNSCRAVVRLCGGAVNTKLHRPVAYGSLWLGEGNVNIGVEVPAWNTNAALTRITVEDHETGGGALGTFIPIYDPGGNAAKVSTTVQDLPSGVRRVTHTVPETAGASGSTLVHEQLIENGTTLWQRLINGALLWRKDTRMKRRGAGSLLVETLNAEGAAEAAKAVALGAGEVRFGEDTILFRGAEKQLATTTDLKVGGKFAMGGNAPVAKAAAIASPAAEAAALKTAVDAIRAALKNLGVTE